MTGDNPDKPGLIGQIKDKLIRSKEEWAKEGRLLTGRPDFGRVNRLPPGQKEVKNWPVLDLGVQPDVKPETLAVADRRPGRKSDWLDAR